MFAHAVAAKMVNAANNTAIPLAINSHLFLERFVAWSAINHEFFALPQYVIGPFS
jgi:hypothetical protein